jgi:hypothetical protein
MATKREIRAMNCGNRAPAVVPPRADASYNDGWSYFEARES